MFTKVNQESDRLRAWRGCAPTAGVEEDEVSPGMVLGCMTTPVPVAHVFETQLAILELLEHKPILSAGYKVRAARPRVPPPLPFSLTPNI